MSQELIEAVARAFVIGAKGELAVNPISVAEMMPVARAALAAIEASGTHVVVPVTPTQEMEDAIWFAVSCVHPYSGDLGKDSTTSVYPDMLLARPKVTT